jgi:hypothetical protein
MTETTWYDLRREGAMARTWASIGKGIRILTLMVFTVLALFAIAQPIGSPSLLNRAFGGALFGGMGVGIYLLLRFTDRNQLIPSRLGFSQSELILESTHGARRAWS